MSRRIKKFKRNKKLMIVLAVFLMSLTLGYSLLAATKSINGHSLFANSKWDIHWDSDSIEVLEGSVNTDSPYVSDDGRILSYAANLKIPGDYYEFTIDAVNAGTIDGMLNIESALPIVKDATGQEIELPSYLKYTITYADGTEIEKNHLLSKRIDESHPTREKYKIKLEFDRETDTLPDNPISIKIENDVPYDQATDEARERDKRELKKYIVTFNPKGGTVEPTTKEVEEEGRYGTLPTPTKAGYTFLGWYLNNEKITSKDEVKITSNVTLEAKYRANEYKITYKLNGGVNSENNPNGYNVDTETITLENPNKTGYIFKGWTGSNGTTPQKNVQIPKGSTGDKSYEANWEQGNYTITYNLNGGENSGLNPSSYTIDSNDIVLEDPSKEGYTFQGWTTTGLDTPTKNIKIPKGSTGNRIYEAHWKVITYKITYALNNGTDNKNNPISYTIETETITLQDPTRSGYTFTGWTGSNGTTPQKNVQIPKGSTGDKNYTSNWTTDSYTITYNLDGGENNSNNPTSYQVDTNTITLQDPTKTGYTFTGWTGSNGSTPQKNVQIPKGSTGNKTYTANWSKSTYTITYTLNGGTNNSNNPSTYQVDTNTITLQDPTRSGYTFTGWTTSGVTTPTKNLTIPKGSTGNKTYEAHWSKDSYTITYSLNNGTNNPLNPTNYDVETNTITLLNPSKTLIFKGNVNGTGATIGSNTTKAQNFAGWTGSNGTTPQTSVTIPKGSTGNKTYEAHWTAVAGTLPKVEKTGYTCGWNTSNTATTIEYASEGTYPTSKITENMQTTINLYAVCTINNYTITYNLDGGANNTNNPSSYNVESNAITLQAPTKLGYTFTGWTGSNGNTPQTTVTIAKGSTGNKEYTAHWSKDTYTISYSLNGGTNSSSNPATYQVDTATITLQDPTRNGYTFVGWTGSNGNAPQKNVQIPKGSTGNKGYYANWTTDSYTITYIMNGGDNSENNPISYNVETETITLQDPTKRGYTFTGWTGSNGTTPQKNVQIPKGSTGDKTYTSNWTTDSYTITYNLDGGENNSNNPTTYTIETNTITLGDPTKLGYTFLGWTGEGITTPTKNIKINKGTTGNKTYNANWYAGKVVDYNANGGTFTNSSTNTIRYQFQSGTGPMTLYSHTPNVDDNGDATETYASNLELNDVVTIPGATQMNIEIWYSTESASYDWVAIYPDGVTPSRTNYSEATISNGKLAGHGSYSGYTKPTDDDTTYHKTFTVNGDTAQFFFRSDSSANYYGYYAIITGTSTGYYAGEDTYNVPTRPCYRFTGWNTLPDGTGTSYSSESTITKNMSEFNPNTTLYAQWERIANLVTFNANGGTVSPETREVAYNQAIGTLPIPTRTDYVFMGWYTGINDGTKVEGTFKPTEDITLYARWSSCNGFATDSWNTIKNNVSNNVSYYPLGCEKPVSISGYDQEFKVRVANNTQPSECSTQVFSQTACGFVLEFSDIITNRGMGTYSSQGYEVNGQGNKGGWEYSEMRAYLNNKPYNEGGINVDYTNTGLYGALPSELRNVIIDTYAVSSHGTHNPPEQNFITMDKLYLLSTKEVLGKDGTSNIIRYDSAEEETRQLDYYKSIGMKTDSGNSVYAQYRLGKGSMWWTRSADISDDDYYRIQDPYGTNYFTSNHGVSPAFRIGSPDTRYIIKLDPNGGEVSISGVSVVAGNTLDTLPTPIREKYEFLGWYTDITAGTQVTTAYSPTSNQTLYAHWRYACSEFENDSWTTISNNVKTNTSYYALGCTKEVNLGTYGTHTVRVVNNTRPSECSTTGFSQSACGFILEFEDIITKHRMNKYYNNNYSETPINGTYNKGSWEYSDMRAFVNAGIYEVENINYSTSGLINYFPSDLRSVIADTKIVSGYSTYVGDTKNFITIDKLYLLTPKEIYNDESSRDTAYDKTRQLDYYKNFGSKKSVKQYNGANNYWWTRTPWSTAADHFFSINEYGYAGNSYSVSNEIGVSPAFRLGNSETSHQIRFNANGGTTPTSSVIITEGNALGTLPTPTKRFYNFVGWYTGLTDGVQVTSSYVPTSNQTLFARWSRKTDIAFEASDIVYFDPVLQRDCYESTFDLNKIRNGTSTCYKWRIITTNDTASKTKVNIQLDHNISNLDRWSNNYDTTGGPNYALTKMAELTSAWTIPGLNYTYDTSAATVNYGVLTCTNGTCKITKNGTDTQIATNVKARMITMEELTANVKVRIPSVNWTLTNQTGYQFDTTGHPLKWLLENTKYDSGSGATSNSYGSTNYGYWTMSPGASNGNAWYVGENANTQSAGASVSSDANFGLRPVIEIEKSKLE